MEKAPLTESQKAILKFIQDACRKNGVAPSYREIQKHFGFSAVGTVQGHVKALKAKGALEETDQGPQRKARSLIPAGQKWDSMRQLPVYGEIAAGGPRDSAQVELGSVLVSEEMCAGECFALRVVGNSMIEAGIFEGDHLIVQKTHRVKSGEIVVALLDGETTVKRYQEKNGQIQLVPENKSMKPISVTTQRFQIQGRVISLQRRF